MLSTDVILTKSANADSSGGVFTSAPVSANIADLFPNVNSEDVNSGPLVTYRKVFVWNNGDKAITQTKIYLYVHGLAGEQIYLALGTANDSTPPADNNFSIPTRVDNSLGDITMAPDAKQAVWIKRVVKQGASAMDSKLSLAVQFDTEAE